MSEWGPTFTSGQQQVYQISGNSPWDPDYTATGTTAWMWPIYNKMYKSYLCTYSKVVCDVQMSNTSAQSEHLFVGYIPVDSDDDSTWPSGYPNWYATRGTQVKDRSWSASDTTRRHLKITARNSTSKFYGRKIDPSLDIVSVSSDPIEEWLHTFVFVNRSTNSTNLFVRFFVTYYVTFSEFIANNTQTQSL